MKHIFIFVLGLISFTEVAFACPNFNGSYTFVEQPWNGSVKIEQRDCRTIQITRVTHLNGRHAEDVQLVSVDAKMHGDTMAFWLDHQLVIQRYVGSAKACEGQYLFNESRCHLMETTLDQDSGKPEMFVWTQTGIWWKEKGNYAKDRYALIRETDNAKFVSRFAQN